MELYKDILRLILYEAAKLSYGDCCSIRLTAKWISSDLKDLQNEWCKREAMKQIRGLKDSLLEDKGSIIYISCTFLVEGVEGSSSFSLRQLRVGKMCFQYDYDIGYGLPLIKQYIIKSKPIKKNIINLNSQNTVTFIFETDLKRFSRF